MLRDPPHYLRALTTSTVPQRLLWLDCQPSTSKEGGAWVDRWSHACLGTTHWTSKRGQRRDTLSIFHDPQAMWCVVADWCRPGKRAVLFAHDLAYHLRISQALIHLPDLGFQLDKIVLERTAAWALFRHGKRSLMCCDLRSFTPASLDQIRADLETTGRLALAELPTDADGDAGSAIRATIVREGVLQLLGWVSSQGLGPFRPTGSGQSYSAFRRRFLRHQLLVHDDGERLEAERQAMWTGRCEAWRHGTLAPGPFIEYDMNAAYCMIAAECQVPAIARRPLRRCSVERLRSLMGDHAVMAEVHLETEVPVVPTQLGERTVWPVGSFSTILWDPELRLALDHATRIRVGRVWPYQTAPALQEFAAWVLDGMNRPASELPPLCRRMLKHWSRCLVGRLGLRYREWESFAVAPEPDLQLVTWLDVDSGEATDVLIAGRQAMILTAMTEGRDSLPQIPGWIMSECRARLWDAMQRVGLDRVAYLDTDSLIVSPSDPPGLPIPLGSPARPDWALKGQYDKLTIHGPRNYSTEQGRKVSGLPLTARQVAPLEFTGQVMRSIKESMRAGELDHVASIPRRFVLDAPDLRRQHLPGGQTTAYRLERNAQHQS